MTKITFPVLLLVFCTLSLTGFGQVPFFQSYSLLKKNEPVPVNAIFQDNNGFIWFGTSKGLFKYNGKNYRRFTLADSLADENVTAIAQDTNGRIWTGHKNGRLSFMEGNRFHTFDTDEGHAVAPVSDILFDKKGDLWFATLNDGLYHFTNNRLHRLDDQEGMPDLFVYDILEDTLGNIWAGTDGGVVICTSLAKDYRLRVLDYDDGLADNIVKRLALAEDQTLWLGTEDAGIIHYDPLQGTFTSLAGKWQSGSIRDFVLKGNQIWIASSMAGLMVYDIRGGAVKEYNRDTGCDLPALSVLMKDREGNIWAASKSGILRTPGDRLEFINTPVKDGDRNVMAVAADRQGNLWFSTREGLFKRTRQAPGQVVTTKQLTSTPFVNYTIISLFVDKDEQVWAGLYGEGVLRIDPRTGKVKHLRKELRNGNVLSISGKENTVWLATLGGAEKITISGNNLEIKNYSRENGLSSDFIYQAFVDSRNRVWFATDGWGIDMLDETGFHHLNQGLASKVVYGFAEDNSQQVWANVQDDGIYRWTGREFVHITVSGKDIHFRDNNISAFSSDAAGNLFVMHDLGIDIYRAEQQTVQYLGEEAGIEVQRANLNAIAKDPDGNLLLGTDGGIIKYNAVAANHTLAPKVMIDAVKISGRAADLDKLSDLRYDQNNVTINFLGFWYEHPEGIHYRYKMDNHDAGWIETGDNNVTYSQLTPGNYTFRVRAAASSSSSVGEEAVMNFVIKPPFWRTPVFYITSVVLLTITAYLFMRYRERKLVADKLLLETMVDERTREIQLQKEEIQAQNEEIMAQAEEIKGINENLEMLVNERTLELEKKNRALEEYAFINAHKLRAPLASILGLTNLIAKTNLDEEARIINQHLQQRADELDDIVRSITKAIEQGDR
jgi:ligand-binding sensor domain-containing protein